MATCDCIASGNINKPKQHGADPHAKNCAIYLYGPITLRAEALRHMANSLDLNVIHEAADLLEWYEKRCAWYAQRLDNI